MVSTLGILLEVGNALSKARHRQPAARVLAALMNDPTITILPIDGSLATRAFNLFINRPDKERGLTDCCSFVVMNELNITQALTADIHFVQAGYAALLRTGTS